MQRSPNPRWSAAALFLLSSFAVSCGGAMRAAAPPPVVPAPAPVQAAPHAPAQPAARPADPIDVLIADSEKLFAEGQKHLEAGHLEQARGAFDRAVEMLLESQYGARTEPRLRQHFDRLVDRINALEVVALRQGDGFTEKRAEPALIDKLLSGTTFLPETVSEKTREAVAADVASEFATFPIALNAKVLSYVEAFQGTLRPFLTDGLTRAGRYLPMIQKVFQEEGLPLELAYVPLIESAFKPSAKSRVSAQGVWQFMVPTARDFGLRYDWFIDERSDPEKSTVAAAKYLKFLGRLFDGDWALALASYNGGQGRVQRAVKNSGITDFWRLTSAGILPRETREYVPMIMAAMIIAKNPSHYGFDIKPLDPLAYDRVRVPGPVDLRKVAEWADVSLDDIEQLNPELRRWTTPIDYPGYELKVPSGRGEPLTERLAKVDPDELVAFKRYNVRRGDTLNSIASKHGVKRTELAVANGLGSKARVRPGQTLIIPRNTSAALASATKPGAVSTARNNTASRSTVQRASRNTAAPRTITYRVKKGDTLSTIAARHDVTVAELKRWNKLRSNALKVGARLTIQK